MAKLTKKPTNRRKTSNNKLLQGSIGHFQFFDDRAMKAFDCNGRINIGTKVRRLYRREFIIE